jgi:hypothetical protein
MRDSSPAKRVQNDDSRCGGIERSVESVGAKIRNSSLREEVSS